MGQLASNSDARNQYGFAAICQLTVQPSLRGVCTTFSYVYFVNPRQKETKVPPMDKSIERNSCFLVKTEVATMV